MATKTYTCPSCGGSGQAWFDDGDEDGYYDECADCTGTGKLTEARAQQIAGGDQGRANVIRTYYGQSAGDIAKTLGVHRQTFHSWTRREDFPAPLGEVAGARVWDIGQVRKWRERVDLKPGRPRND